MEIQPRTRVQDWNRGPLGSSPWPLGITIPIFPFLLFWTLPQSIVGLLYAACHRLRGTRPRFYRFGPFVYLVMPVPPFRSRGISLGFVVFADDPQILTHEFCHTYTALWLSWLYLPVYGLEYLVFGHDRSPHESLTRHFEKTCTRSWKNFG